MQNARIRPHGHSRAGASFLALTLWLGFCAVTLIGLVIAVARREKLTDSAPVTYSVLDGTRQIKPHTIIRIESDRSQTGLRAGEVCQFVTFSKSENMFVFQNNTSGGITMLISLDVIEEDLRNENIILVNADEPNYDEVRYGLPKS